VRVITCLLSLYLLISSQVFATPAKANIHLYPMTTVTAASAEQNKPFVFGTCDIEIINDSFSNVTVYGRYDDGIPLVPFSVYSYEYSHYIDLFYNGYCHSGMYLSIVTFTGYTIFSGYVFTGSTLHIVPLFGKSVKVTVESPKAVA
jgi:hypothetical protein